MRFSGGHYRNIYSSFTEVNMYYGYLNDTMFKKQSSITQADKPYPTCVIDRIIGNYFNNELIVADIRSERLQLGGKVIKGKLSFHYDGTQHQRVTGQPEIDIFKKLSNGQLQVFFNIVEIIFTANGDSEQTLNRSLVNSALTNSAYVPDTLNLSRTSVVGIIYDIDGLTPTTEISLVTYFDFNVKFQDMDEETIRIYLDRTTFLNDYPLSTITDVILPCDHLYILDPTKVAGTIDMMIKSNEWSFNELNNQIKPEDHTGLMTYWTKYVTKNPSATQMLPFGVLYQGAIPSSLAIREAIRNKLLKYGTAEASVWEIILPDLFVLAQFFIVPMWDNQVQRPDGYLYPSIINAFKYKETIGKFFTSMSAQYINTNQEMFVCGQSELFLSSLPDPLNKEEFSIQKKHPTYQYHMSDDGSSFTNMEPKTREFNTRLNRAMAVACGETTTADVINNVINGLDWHSFTSSNTEYHVLSKASYMKFLNITE